MSMAICIGDITFDALHPAALARFWAAVLHYEIQVLTADFAAIADPQALAPRCCFQKTETCKTGKNRIHLDLHVRQPEQEAARLEELGAVRLREGREGEVSWIVLQDPEGNEFCVQAAPPGANGARSLAQI